MMGKTVEKADQRSPALSGDTDQTEECLFPKIVSPFGVIRAAVFPHLLDILIRLLCLVETCE